MGERMLRGSRLGAVSYESDRNTEFAPRQTREFSCVNGHRFEVPFAVVQRALSAFTGVQRRFQVKGEVGGVLLVDDYGLHLIEDLFTFHAAHLLSRVRVSLRVRINAPASAHST
jgi:UDP-N-acetylmuramate-alanine ligase